MLMRLKIKPLLDNSTEQDFIDGVSWYVDAHDHALRMAQDHGVDFLKVCGIISSLSPSVKWDINLRDAENLICNLVYLDNRDVTVSTYGVGLAKAIEIFYSDGRRETIEKILLGVRGYKTHAFFLNISHLDCNRVTADRHILSAIKFKGKSLTGHRYKIIENFLQRKAKQYNLLPCDLQAWIWVTYLREKNLN